MAGDFPWALLDRHFAGECTPDEIDRIRAWAAADADHARQLAEAHEVWLRVGPRSRRLDVDAAWASMQRRMRASPLTRPAAEPRVIMLPRGQNPSRRRLTATNGMRIAATVLVLLASAALLSRWLAPGRGEAAMHTYLTEAGQTAEIDLADGTRVVLAARTRLRVPEDYGQEGRVVYLEAGEAFFSVRHDEDRPFRVVAPGAVAEDLGTEFIVRAEARDSAVVVVVASGEVVLRAAGGQRGALALSAGELGRVDAGGTVRHDTTVDVAAHLAWLGGELAFDRVPLALLARELERWFDVEVRVADADLAAVPVTGRFDRQSLDQILDNLAAVSDLRYERSGDTVTLHALQSTTRGPVSRSRP